MSPDPGGERRLTPTERRQAAHVAFEQAALDLRHEFGPGRPVARLLLGALAAGEVTSPECRAALEELQTHDPEAGRLDVAARMPAMEVRAARLRGGDPPRLRQAGGTVLLADAAAPLWAPFVGAVFGRPPTAAVTAEAAEQAVRADPRAVRLVLLDLMTDEEDPPGLTALRAIKRIDPTLPVIVATDRDDARLARRCLDAGAADYYLKDLNADVRPSLAYFVRFKEAVTETAVAAAVRELWRRVSGLSGPIAGEMGRPVFETVCDHLRRAVFFLSADAAARRAALFCRPGGAGANVNGHAAMECGMALEQMAGYAAELNARRRGLAAPEALSFNERMELVYNRGQVDRSLDADVRRAWWVRGNAAHAGVLSEADAVFGLTTAVAVAEQFFARAAENT